jgi:hypothetical protein
VTTAIFIPSRKEDWDWARIQYEHTEKTATDIATEIGVSATVLLGRASRGQWQRSAGAAVARAKAELIIAEESKKIAKFEVLERVNAQMQAQVLKEHRKDIGAARNICTRLFTELGTAVGDEDTALEQKAKVLGRLAETMKTLILLERQAFGITGVFEEPEQLPQAAQPTPQAADLVMQKFAAVLAKRMGAVEVVSGDARD